LLSFFKINIFIDWDKNPFPLLQDDWLKQLVFFVIGMFVHFEYLI